MTANTSAPSLARHPTYSQHFSSRAALPDTNRLTAYLLRLMVAKKTNLCVSADVQSTAELLDVAEECGESICILKTHCDIIYDFDDRTIKGLLEIAGRKNFLIFEDRKFGDIGSTHRIATWATITNAHIFPGPAIITALKETAKAAAAVSGLETSTQIYGGNTSSRQRKISIRPESSDGDRTERNDSDKDDDADDDDEGEEEIEEYEDPAEISEPDSEASHQAIRLSQSDLSFRADRKASVVSISTTISSTTELVSPPIVHPGLANPNATAIATLGRPPLARGLLLLAQMSSKDNLFTPSYTDKCIELARGHKDFVMGFIAQETLNRAPEDNFLVMTPGVSLPTPSDSINSSSSRLQRSTGTSRSSSNTSLSSGLGTSNSRTPMGDSLGQQYNTPKHVILDKGADVIIVGRSILNAEDRVEEVERYRWEGWLALEERWRGKK